MKKYDSKEQVIEAAQAAGSAAKTFRGAAKFLIAAARNTTPLERRGFRVNPRLRDRKAALDGRYLSCAERIARRLGLWSLDVAVELADSLTSALCRAAEKHLIRNWPYRRSESSWAGGDHSVDVEIGKPWAWGGSTRAWSRNGKWSGTNSFAKLTVSPTAIILFPTLTTPDGLAVIDAERIGNRIYRITWLEQGRGFDLKAVSGWLIRGVHVQAATLEQARKKAGSARAKAAAAHLAARLVKTSLNSIWVGLNDSFAAGNCRPSTFAFYEQLKTRFGSEVGGLRADELLKIRDDLYTRRAVSAAAKRCIVFKNAA